MNNINWGYISSYRQELMGISILMILFYHLGYLDILNIGVDLFLLLSAIGIYYSLKKEVSTLQFFKKRVYRIIPEFLLVSIPVSLLFYFKGGWSLIDSIAVAAGASVLVGQLTFWFIPMIILCYLFSPLWYERIESKNNNSLRMGALTLLTISSAICAYFSENAFLIFSRFPIYFLGMSIAHWVREGKEVRRSSLLLCLVITLIGAFISYYLTGINANYTEDHLLWTRIWTLTFFTYFIYALPLLVCLAVLLHALQTSDILKRIHLSDTILQTLRFFGSITLELYLIHELLCIRIAIAILSKLQIDNSFCVGITSILIAIPMALLLKKINGFIVGRIQK